MKRTLVSLAFALVVAAAGVVRAVPGEPAMAPPVNHDPALLAALAATCGAPSRPDLEAIQPDAAPGLVAVARDRSQSDYVRLRALTLLSHFPDATTAAWLTEFMDDESPRLRGLSVYTYARTFGAALPDSVFAAVARFAAPTEPTEVREYALRGLGWVPSRAAIEFLTAVAAVPATTAPVTEAEVATARLLARVAETAAARATTALRRHEHKLAGPAASTP